MNISPLNPAVQASKPLGTAVQNNNSTTPFEAQKSFVSVLKRSIENLNENPTR